MVLVIGSDHAGFELKTKLKTSLAVDLNVVDVGVVSSDPMDYPDIADLVASKMRRNPEARGLLICGSGQGMCMRANRYEFLRAALCFDAEQVRLAREHNDANVLCLPGRWIDLARAHKMMNMFLKTSFAGGRHLRRVQKLSQKPEG